MTTVPANPSPTPIRVVAVSANTTAKAPMTKLELAWRITSSSRATCCRRMIRRIRCASRQPRNSADDA